ncbi:MAG TPA: glycosyltransferase [Deinococcales bacterium]|nr:glycosyltransferase [Deinococcales bacterium]
MPDPRTDRPLSIGLFTDTYEPQINGVVTSVTGLASALREMGHQVTIVAPRHPNQSLDPNVIRLRSTTYFPEPGQRMSLPPSPRKLLALRARRFDIIHTHGAFTLPVIGLSVARSFGLPIVHTYHTRMRDYVHYYPWYPPVAWLTNQARWYMTERASRRLRSGLDRSSIVIAGRFDTWFANRCFEVIAPAEPIAAELREMGVRRPVLVIPNGIDLASLTAPQPDPFPALGVREGPRLLTAGRLAKEKSFDVLLRHFQQIHRARPDATLILLGDGPERANLEALAGELGIRPGVVFAGYADPKSMGAHYQHADLFVFTSLSETQGLVALEAAACGLPIVARAEMGITKCVLDGVTGFLVPPDDGEQFVARTLQLLSDPALRDNFSQSGIEWAGLEGSHRRMAERILGSYRRAIRGFTGWPDQGPIYPELDLPR